MYKGKEVLEGLGKNADNVDKIIYNKTIGPGSSYMKFLTEDGTEIFKIDAFNGEVNEIIDILKTEGLRFSCTPLSCGSRFYRKLNFQ